MRSAAYFAATLIAMGLYIAAAAVLALTPAWIGIGMLAIASLSAVSLVARDRQLPAR